VVVTIIPLPEHRDVVREAPSHAIGRVHAEDTGGCLLYALHESDARFWMLEKWASAGDLETHGAGAAITELNQALSDTLAGPPDIQVFRAIPAGTEKQGRL
jgi:quinol monooxygenase YgiN